MLGAGTNSTAQRPIYEGQVRLLRATDANWTAREFVSVLFASNITLGRWAEQVTNMFECPDFFPIGENGKGMLIASKIFQGPRWVAGANIHWDEYYLGTFDGNTFSPERHGVVRLRLGRQDRRSSSTR